MDEWTTIESDPGVFTELIQAMGVKDVEVEEVYSMDLETLNQSRPVYGLIFLFKWQQETDDRPTLPFEETKGKMFFAKQMVTNACATQALLAILLNQPELELGEGLQQLREFTVDFDAEMKGHAIGGSTFIRTAHNSFRSANPVIEEQDKEEVQKGEAFHFIAYVPIQGTVYELDGLKPGPISLGECTKEADWMEKALPHIQQRITRYTGSEIRFNLLALKKDHRRDWRKQIEAAKAAPQSSPDGSTDDFFNELEQRLKLEDAKHANWHTENVRRKHNYFPFIFNLLRILGEENQLQPLIEIARTKQDKKPDDSDS